MRQKVEEPAQLVHEASQAANGVSEVREWKTGDHVPMQVRLSWEETVVPEGQLLTQVPLLKKNPGKHPVHCFWEAIDAPLKPGI